VAPWGKNVRHKRTPVAIDVPEGSKFVPDGLTIEAGTTLQACWARKAKAIKEYQKALQTPDVPSK